MEHEWFKLYDDSFLDCTYYSCKNCNQEAWEAGNTVKKWANKSVANKSLVSGKKYLVNKTSHINFFSNQETFPCDEAIIRAALE